MGKLFVWRATLEKKNQPRAAHSHDKLLRFIQCINNHIFILGTVNAIYTVIVRNFANIVI